jgi:DNA-directed RNA polymerase subunit RPC12/RpoP
LERAYPAEEPLSPCPKCDESVALRADALSEGALTRCPVCGLKVLYRQKDFNQAIGCAVVLLAAILAPFTFYASLVVAALIDLVMYRLAGEVVICYGFRCRAHLRGLPAGPSVLPFDLSIHDYHRSLALNASAEAAQSGGEPAPRERR